MKTNNFETAVMIQVTHSGQIYEQSFSAQEKERKKKIWSERLWNIITLILSAIISVILNLFMNMGG